MTTISNAIKQSLPKVDWSPTPLLDLEILLSHIIGKDRVFISANPDYQLSERDVNEFEKLIDRRSKQEPIAYIIGNKTFYDYNFIVNNYVLIPRPETELLVEEALKYIQKNQVNSIVDVGTGSGCIIITIAKELQKQEAEGNRQLLATDISKEALKIAKQNYESNFPKREIKIEFVESHLLEKIDTKIDLLVSNLPYIPQREYLTLEKNVVKFEPKQALVGGNNGYELIERLLKQALNKMKERSLILLEINHDQGESVAEIAKKYFPKSKIDVIKDYANFDRFIRIENN